MDELRCLPIRITTDGPLFGSQPGTLSALSNMRLRPGGFAEARGGFSELQPSGGTAADAISAGAFSDVIQMSTSYGWIRYFDGGQPVGSQYSENKQLEAGCFNAFGAGGVANNALYFGSDDKFSRVMVVTVGLGGPPAVVYEYWNGSTWTALTTAETIDWTLVRTPTFASWTLPTDWVANTVGDAGTGNVLKYWVRIRATGAPGTYTVCYAQVFGSGMREIYAATQSPRTSATSGILRRHGQTGTTEEWFSVGTSLYSAHSSPARLIEYRGRIIMVNGKETKRFDGAVFSDLGPSNTPAINTMSAQPGGVLGAGVWRYYAAFGYGPSQLFTAYSDRQDATPLYGTGRAYLLGEVTTVAAQRVRFDMSAGYTADTGSWHLYRTDDLTNVPAADRANAPAYLIQSFRSDGSSLYEQLWGFVGAFYYDDNLAFVFPLQEAKNYDVSPPARCKFSLIYQNRLMLGDDETWYVSDPFQPDWFSQKSFKYMRLAKASGGRHMGGIAFADQAVLWTEDETWGITNIEQDVPQYLQIHPSVGNVAPDAAASGDGVLIWPGQDGFYLWDGDGKKLPQKITTDFDSTFGKMSYETHGGSRAVIADRCYKVAVCAPGGTPSATYAYDLDTGQWSTWTLSSFASTLAPLARINAPLGNADAWGVHTLWGKVDYGTGAGEYGLFLDELTTQDAGNNYTCSGTMYFPQMPGEVFTPAKVFAYYQASSGWQTPTLSAVSGDIGTGTGTLTSGTPDVGTDYSIVGGTYAQVGRGTSDIQVTFQVQSQAGGTVNGQRLFGAIIKGSRKGIRRGML